MMKNIGWSVFLLFVGGAVLAMLSSCGGGLKGDESDINVPHLSGDFLKQFTWEQEAPGHDSTVFTGYDKSLILKVRLFKDMDTERASDYISSKAFVTKSLYREIHSPYPGPLSNRIECAEEFKPVEIERSPFNYYLIYATDRLTYGACSWDIITYRTILYFHPCGEEESLYQIELFIPVDEYNQEYEEALKAIGCS